MDPAVVRLILILLVVAAVAILATYLLSLAQKGRKNAFWKYLPAILLGIGFVVSVIRSALTTEGFADIAFFLTALMALAGALPALIAALILGKRKRRLAASEPGET